MKLKYSLFICLIIFLSFLTFNKAFSFAFIVDDWFQLWGALFERPMLDRYFSDHPGVVLEFILLSRFFYFNPIYYYIIGFILKIICSLVVSLFAYGLTKSNKVSLFAGLLFASSVMGLETFSRISAHYAAFSIILLSLGMYFWVQPIDKNFLKTIISIVFITIALIGDPGSSIMVLPLMVLWDISTFYQNHFQKEELKSYMTRLLSVCVMVIFVNHIISKRVQYFTSNSYSSHIQYAITHLSSSLNNYLNSIGHLIVGWIVPINEMIGISNPTVIGLFAGYLLVAIAIIITILFIRTRKIKYKIIFFLLNWILVFYFPSWITQKHIVVGNLIIGVTNRYLAVSAIAVIIVLALTVASIKKVSHKIFLLILIVAANILMSNYLLSKEQEYRSLKVQELLYNKIDSDVPKNGEKNSIFIYLGDNLFRVFALDWNGAYPFALKRHIKMVDQFPFVTNNLQDAANKLCTENKYKLSNVYAWTVDYQNIVDVSQQVREKIRPILSCSVQI